MEALEFGATALLIDEDTCATNFMIRDARMQALVGKRELLFMNASPSHYLVSHCIASPCMRAGIHAYILQLQPQHRGILLVMWFLLDSQLRRRSP